MLWRLGTLSSRFAILGAYAASLPIPAGLLLILHAFLWLAVYLLFFSPRLPPPPFPSFIVSVEQMTFAGSRSGAGRVGPS